MTFLPANVELAERPVHPAPRWTMRIIALLALMVLIIGLVGHLDIVVTTKGKFVPNNRVKIVQSAITGVVKDIFVHDGEHVTAGTVLMDLDATQAGADTVNAHEEEMFSALAAARAQSLLTALKQGKAPQVPKVPGILAEKQAEAQMFADGQYREFEDKKAEAEAELLQHKADLESTLHDIGRLRQTAPMARQQANDYKALVKNKYVSQVDYLDKEQSAIQEESDLAAKQSYADELSDAIAAQAAQIASLASQFKREQLDAFDQQTEKFEEARNAELKAITRQRLMTLYAPVNGTIQQLSIHTLGGVVTVAQSLMEIVPDDGLEIEVDIDNKDVGFVKSGQDAIVKIDAFPYTRYGYLTGRVDFVSNDAVENKKNGLSFVAHIGLHSQHIEIKNQTIRLTPGMAVTAEIKTGRRSVLGYFLDPVMQTAQESLRER